MSKQNNQKMRTRKLPAMALAIMLATAMLAACSGSSSHSTSSPTTTTTTNQSSSINKIQHIIVIMQENRSFDTYFGTYPGADGIPMQNGVPTVCVNDPQTGQCVKPYHDSQNLNHGGPHGAVNATADINNGKMDGFIGSGRKGQRQLRRPP